MKSITVENFNRKLEALRAKAHRAVDKTIDEMKARVEKT